MFEVRWQLQLMFNFVLLAHRIGLKELLLFGVDLAELIYHDWLVAFTLWVALVIWVSLRHHLNIVVHRHLAFLKVHFALRHIDLRREVLIYWRFFRPDSLRGHRSSLPDWLSDIGESLNDFTLLEERLLVHLIHSLLKQIWVGLEGSMFGGWFLKSPGQLQHIFIWFASTTAWALMVVFHKV